MVSMSFFSFCNSSFSYLFKEAQHTTWISLIDGRSTDQIIQILHLTSYEHPIHNHKVHSSVDYGSMYFLLILLAHHRQHRTPEVNVEFLSLICNT